MRSKSSKIELSVQTDPQFEGKLDIARLSDVAHRALRTEGLNHPATVGLLITDDATIRELNRRYRGQDAATDVLAFGSEDEEDGFVSPPGQPQHLGDIVLSYPRAATQAEQHELPVKEELDRLLVHGLLHLLGYEDYKEEERREMWDKQESILRSIYANGRRHKVGP